jgi:hypothetical protein
MIGAYTIASGPIASTSAAQVAAGVAQGAALVSASTISPGAATGNAAATAPGASLTATSSIAPGAASGDTGTTTGGGTDPGAITIPASRTVVFEGGSRVVNFGTENIDAGSAASGGPYFENGKWWLPKDPDDKRYYVGNVGKDLTDSGTTAVSFIPVVEGVTVIESGAPQGTLGELLVVKLGGMGVDGEESFCTFRVTCANTEQFDRTIHFKRVDN